MVPSGPPKAITCEDSFKSCTSFDAVATVVCPCSGYCCQSLLVGLCLAYMYAHIAYACVRILTSSYVTTVKPVGSNVSTPLFCGLLLCGSEPKLHEA